MPAELAEPVAAEAKELSYAEAIREGLAQAMEADPRVFLFGEDVGVYGGAFGVSGDLLKRFGPERVIDTPISELGLAGAAVGAAMTGMRPVLEIQFSDFVTLAMEQIVNQAAKIRFMFGGKASVPMVIRLPGGSGTGAAGQHSQSLEAWFAHVPGLKVLQPSTPHDAKGLLLAAIDDPNPVLIFEHKLLYKTKGRVPSAPYRVPIGQAVVRREGSDVTIVAASIMTLRALAAAERPVIVVGGGAKNSSTSSASPQCAKAWCQVPGPNVSCSPRSTLCTSPVSGLAATIVPESTCSTSSAPKTVRYSGECRNDPPRGRQKMSAWIRSVDA